MKFTLAALFLCAITLQAAIAPIYHLDAKTTQVFNDYIAKFERDVVTPYTESGRLWIDDHYCCVRNSAFDQGKQIVEPRENADVAEGSIHHFSGAMHIAGASIEDVRRIMQDYPNYPKYFTPDVGQAAGTLEPDSAPADEHYTSQMTLVQATLWINVTYDCTYDVHYRRLDARRWMAKSAARNIRERRDPKDATHGYFPEGDDHGFLWRTNTYWFVRQNNGGIDLEVDSITVSRPVPTGFGWWGTKRTRDAVDKMLRDISAAVADLHRNKPARS